MSDDPIADALAARGFAVAPEFLGHNDVSTLHSEALRRRAAGEFHAARIGRGDAMQRDAAIRGDEICWLDARTASGPERALIARLDALRVALNRSLFLALHELEAHYACYAPGASYARHLDRFREDDARVVSLVLYLNASWRDADGGALRLFASAEAREEALEIAPHGGTLVAFRSDTIAHEVLAARAERFSIAGWLRKRA